MNTTNSNLKSNLKKYYIYTLTNIFTNQIYVGCTTNPKNRIMAKKYTSAIRQAINQYGIKAFDVKIVETTDSKENARRIEQSFIDHIPPEQRLNKTSATINASGYHLTTKTRMKQAKAVSRLHWFWNPITGENVRIESLNAPKGFVAGRTMYNSQGAYC